VKRYQVLGLAAATAMSLHAQAIGQAQAGGQAEVALQGFYQGGASQPLIDTTGVALKFQELFPKFGLIRLDLEGYRTGAGIQAGDNFLELRGLVLGGLRWNLTGGDFRVPASPIQNPFFNLFFPELNARGVQIEAGNSRSAYTVFYGNETLLAGPRIPFRIDVPQTAMGISIRQKFGRLETGVRLLHLTSSKRDLEGNPIFFAAGRSFLSADNLTFYTAYFISEHFRLYGEATAARAETIDGQPAGQPISYFFGPSWESPRVTVRANYSDFGRSYLPQAGYSVGDRKGPYAEVRLRPLPPLVLFGSASRYETTEKHDPVIPYIRSTSTSAGVSVELPWKFNASAQLSTIQFYLFNPASAAEQNSRNRQATGTLSRQLGHQTLRFTASDMRLMVSGLPSRQRSGELEDTIHFRRFVLGGAGRVQQSLATDHRNSVYVRGSAQIDLGRLTAFGYFEGGKDLVNQTIFATNTISSSVVTASLRLTRKWSIKAEAYRSRSIASLNPESLFVQGNSGVIADLVLSRFNQWSYLFKVVRSFNWGNGLPAGSVDDYMRQRMPLTGGVEGLVHVRAAGGSRPAPGVVVTLESGLRATTDLNGRYRFDGVAEGLHTVSINMEELPADYNPGEKTKSPVSVFPRKSSRADLEIYALSAFVGKVTVLPGSAFDGLEGIVIRLEPGQRYTTTLNDGSFAFYNTPDGDYQLRIDERTLPPDARLKSAPNVALVIGAGSVPAAVQFEIDRIPAQEKRIRKVLEQRIEIPLAPAAEDRRAIRVAEKVTEDLVKAKPEVHQPVKTEPAVSASVPAVLPGAKLDAKSVAARNARGRELMKQGKYREAIEELSLAIRQDPDCTLALNARGFAYYLLRDYTRALADLDAAIRLNPKYVNAYQNRSKARKASGDDAGSAADEQRLRELR
jgi:hypothetical protein